MPVHAQRNLYTILGLPRSASPEAIKHAYHTLAKAYHPDGVPADEVMEKAFVEIAAAAALLRDPTKRRLYDRGDIDESGHFTPEARKRRDRSALMRVFFLALVAGFGATATIAYYGHPYKTEFASNPIRRAAVHTEVSSAVQREPAERALPSNPSPVSTQSEPPKPAEAAAASSSAAPGPKEPRIGNGQSLAAATPEVSPQPTEEPTGYLPPPKPALSNPAPSQQVVPALRARSFGLSKRSGSADADLARARERTRWKRMARSRLFDTPEARDESDDDRTPAPTRGAKTAACLACLTNAHGSCSALCP